MNITDAPTTQPPTTTDPNATLASTAVPMTTMLPDDTFYDSVELLDITVREPVLCETSYGVQVPCDFDGDGIPSPEFNSTSGVCDYVVKKVRLQKHQKVETYLIQLTKIPIA